MKNLFLAILLVNFIALNLSYGAEQWDKTDPAGTESPSDLDTIIQANNEAVDRLLYLQRINCNIVPDTSSQITVLAGSVAIPNSAGTVVRYRINTSSTTVTWANIDTGAEATDTQYYIYAVADADATTFTVKISTSNSAPDSTTYYRLIGYFYNDDSGDIVSVGNIGGNIANKISVHGTDDITTTSTTYEDMDDMIIYFYSEGKGTKVTFNAPIYIVVNQISYYSVNVDGVEKKTFPIGGADGCNVLPCPIVWDGVLSAGTHTIKIQWKVSGSTGYQRGSTYGYRTLIVEE